MRMPMTLRSRLTIWYCSALTVLLVCFGLLVYGMVRHRMIRHHDGPLQEMAAAVLHILNEQEDCHTLTEAQTQTLNQLGRLILVHEVEGGHQVFYESPEMKANVLAPEVGALGWAVVAKPTLLTIEHNGLPWRVLSMPYRSRLGRLGNIRLMENLGDLEAALKSLRLTLFLMTPAGILLSALGGFWLAGKALAPVAEVTRMARAIEASSLDQRLPAPGTQDEIGRLVETLNHMFARLESSFEAMKRFTADASHELRTPLATLRNTIDVALDRPRSVVDQQAALVSVGEEVQRLQSIVEDLLLLARADAGRLSLRRESLDLALLAASLADTYDPKFQERSITLQVQAEQPAAILGDERWLCQVVGNLLDNALTFTPDGGRIELEVATLGSSVQLRVADSGPGIPEASLERIFERFYQTEASRTRRHNRGAGLGLAISAWIVKAHDGTIAAANRPEGGACLTVRLPSCNSDSVA
jgi:heavy metal sensor kinase